ncbi:MAG: hypothetical protein NVS2B4_00200 [Ramlibacter sp.]
MVLLVCAVARAPNTTPIRTITEVVSVTYVPTRAVVPAAFSQPIASPLPAALAAQGRREQIQPAVAQVKPPDAIEVLQPKPEPRASNGLGLKAAPRHKRPIILARGHLSSPRAMVLARGACARPACCDTGTHNGSVQPHVVPVFAPMRELGLLLQAKLGGPHVRQACQAPMRGGHPIA